MRQWTEQDVWKGYPEPVLNRFNLEQTMQALLGRARDLLPFFSPKRWHPEPRQTIYEEVPKVYLKPALRKITPEQASLLLIGHASVGAQGARHLLEVVFPDPSLQSWGSVPGRAAGASSSEVYGRCPAPDCP